MHVALSPHRITFSLSASLCALMLSACPGDGGVEANATASITSIAPAEVYPGVQIEVAFEVAAGEGTEASELTWSIQFGDGASAEGDDVSETLATHTYTDSGTYTIKLEAFSGSDVVATDTTSLEVLAPVDLVVASPRAQPANANTGEPVLSLIHI